MSVKQEASGRRSVEVEVEVPGTPEDVWQAIATGPGVSAWFVPCGIDERVGGTVTSHFAPGMDSVATVTAWEPPHRFAAESADLGPEAPSLATEWSVEARDGGVCVVRVVHSLFSSGDDWDGQLESVESGWPAFFRILKAYLAHFRGLPCSSFRAMAVAPEPVAAAWETLMGALGLAGATAGEHRIAPAEAPPLAGVVEKTDEGLGHLHQVLRLDRPTPGTALFSAMPMGGKVILGLAFYLYGDTAEAAARRDEPAWKAWVQKRFTGLGAAEGPC
jgi:uncharacterized protein YndB with AHSA1/START domain